MALVKNVGSVYKIASLVSLGNKSAIGSRNGMALVWLIKGRTGAGHGTLRIE